MDKLLIIELAVLFTVGNALTALADKVEDAYFIGTMSAIEQVTAAYRDNLKSILEDKKFNPSQDCPEIEKGIELFQKTLIIVNELEVTPNLSELQRLYKVLLRERRALSARLLDACYSQKITSEADKRIEEISKRIDLYSFQVDKEGKSKMDYISQLQKEVSKNEIDEFEDKFFERINKKLQVN